MIVEYPVRRRSLWHATEQLNSITKEVMVETNVARNNPKNKKRTTFVFTLIEVKCEPKLNNSKTTAN